MFDKVQVYLDSNIVIQAGKPPASPLLERVGDLVTLGRIDLLVTDVTKAEVANKHVENDYSIIKDAGRSHFRRLICDTLGVDLPKLSKTDIRNRLVDKYVAEVDAMFCSIGADTLSVDDVSPSSILKEYASRSGFFGPDGKKDQFPDAFIFGALAPLANNESPVIIVSDDRDFLTPSKEEEHIILLRSLPELFKWLGLAVEDPDIEAQLVEREQDVLEAVSREIGNWTLQATDIIDAEIEPISATAIHYFDLTSFGETGDEGRLLVVGHALVSIHVWFSHPDWDTASYDSEDKILIPHGDVSGERILETEIKFFMTILTAEDGRFCQVEDLQFLDEDFLLVELEDLVH